MIKIVRLLFLIGLTSCAKPKYWTPPQVTEPTPLQNEAGDCSLKFKNSGLCYHWNWEIAPTTKNRATLILKTYRINKYDQSIVYADLGEPPVLVPSMPSMGHGTAKTVTTVLDTGTYRIERISLYMTGEWLLQLSINNNGEKIDEAEFIFNM